MGINEVLGVDELVDDKRVWRAFVAEYIGTFVVVFIGTATVQITGERIDIGTITKISFAFGLVMASVIKAIYHLSGGHVNPAVTLSFLIAGPEHIKFLKAFIYMGCQFLGGITGSAVLRLVAIRYNPAAMGITYLGPGIKPVNGLIMEICLTFMVVLYTQGVFDPKRTEIRASKPLGIGIAVVAAHMAGIPWTGCGINPARSLGPAVITNEFTDIWIYFAGPFIGGTLAAVVYRFIYKKTEIKED